MTTRKPHGPLTVPPKTQRNRSQAIAIAAHAPRDALSVTLEMPDGSAKVVLVQLAEQHIDQAARACHNGRIDRVWELAAAQGAQCMTPKPMYAALSKDDRDAWQSAARKCLSSLLASLLAEGCITLDDGSGTR